MPQDPEHHPRRRSSTSGENTQSTPDPAPGSDAPRDKAAPEVGGRKGPDPTRFGDWEKDGRCIDF